MAISRMNAVFAKHHRWIFGVFTVIIIITFVGFLSPGEASFLEGFTGTGSVGSAFGHNISRTDLQEQLRYDALVGMLNGRQPSDQEQANMNAFSTLAGGYAAAERGLSVTDYELAQVLRSLPFFVNPTDGKFDKAAYQRFLDSVPVRAADFEEALRRLLLVEKLQESLRASTAVSADEVRDFYRFNNEIYDIRVARFNSADYLAAIVPGETELIEFFRQNGDRFKIPSKMEAEVVAFDLNDPALLAAAGQGIDDAALQSFFDANSKLFVRRDAEGNFAVPAFDTVKSEVAQRLIREKARQLAHAQAADFIRAAIPGVQGKEKRAAFEQVAAARNLALLPTGEFRATDATAGAIAEPALVRAFAGLTDAVPMTSFVDGSDRVYVGLLTKRTPERAAEYSEVATEVLSTFRKQKAVEAARAAAAERGNALLALPPAELAAAVEAATLPAFTALPPMTRRELDSPYNAEMMAIGALVSELAPGGLSPVNDTFDGAVIAYVAQRTPADPAQFDGVKASLEGELQARKEQLNALNFMNYLNANCTYTLGSGNE